MNLRNPTASLNTIPRRLVAALFLLFVTGVVAALTVPQASAKFSKTATNTSNAYAASSCFQPVDVSMVSGDLFSPATLTIKAACSVTWTNTTYSTHTTANTTPSTGSLWSSGNMGRNATFTRQFLTTGSFPYKCTLHTGMTGTITVN
jgi:plastocyanin